MKIQNTLVAAVAMTFAAALSAQSIRYESAPKGHLSYLKAGNGVCTSLGALSNGRMQFANAFLRGDGKKKVVRLYFRRDKDRTYYSYNGMGRTWNRVQLFLGETDAGNFKNDFANYKTTATEVFSARHSWATKTGKEANGAWGTGGTYMFLSKPWTYSGKQDILMDFLFHGGVLANKRSWGTSWYSYYTDGVRNASQSYALATVSQVPAKNTCNDSALTHTYGAQMYYAGTVYSDDYQYTSYRGKYFVRHYAGYTAPKSLVIQAASVMGFPAGVNVGAKCNKHYIDHRGVIGYTFRTASASGYSGYSLGNGYYIVPFDNAWSGLTLWYQAAWEDTVSRTLALTRGMKVVLPIKPKPQKRQMLYSTDRLAKKGVGPFNYEAYQPLPLFGYQ